MAHTAVIRLESYSKHILNQVCSQVMRYFVEKEIHFIGPVYLPTHIRRFTILKSPHVYKTSREQLEQRVHKRNFLILNKFSVIDNIAALKAYPEVYINIKFKT